MKKKFPIVLLNCRVAVDGCKVKGSSVDHAVDHGKGSGSALKRDALFECG